MSAEGRLLERSGIPRKATYSVAEALAMLAPVYPISRRTLYRKIAEGEVEAIQPRGFRTIRIPGRELARLLATLEEEDEE